MTTSTIPSTEKILQDIEQLTVLKIVELVKKMEEKFGVSAAMPLAVAAPSGVASAPVEEKTEFTVMLMGFGDKKIAVIKVIREEVGGLGLAEAKKIVEDTQNGPVELKAGISKADSEQLKQKLEAAGASVEVR